MNILRFIAHRYRSFLFMAVVLAFFASINIDIGISALKISAYQLGQMLLVVPPIFILLGLMDVWVPKETIMKYMGENSGLKGIILAFVIGSAAAGPLYGAFPVAAVFMKKGVKFSNLLIFVGAWSTTKIPTLLFEVSSLGLSFAITRLIVNVPGIILIAYVLTKVIPKSEVEVIYKNAESLNM